MSCFFPTIFKKNAYKKARFLVVFFIILVSVALLSFSGCKAARTVVSAPFKAVGWGASKVGEMVEGKEKESGPKIYELNPDGTLTEKNVDKSKKNTTKAKNKINFHPLLFWAMMVAGIAIAVRFLTKRYVKRNTKE